MNVWQALGFMAIGAYAWQVGVFAYRAFVWRNVPLVEERPPIVVPAVDEHVTRVVGRLEDVANRLDLADLPHARPPPAAPPPPPPPSRTPRAPRTSGARPSSSFFRAAKPGEPKPKPGAKRDEDETLDRFRMLEFD